MTLSAPIEFARRRQRDEANLEPVAHYGGNGTELEAVPSRVP